MPPESVYQNLFHRKQPDTLQQKIKELCTTTRINQEQRFKIGDAVVIHAGSHYYPHQMEEAGWEFGQVTDIHREGTAREYYHVKWPNGYSNFYESYKLVTGMLFETNESASVLLRDDDDGL